MQRHSNTPKRSARFACQGLDWTIHERARLAALTCLITHSKGLTFGDLKALCGLTDGNLSQHLRVLEAAAMVEISKSFKSNRPRTLCRITPKGRRSYLNYIAGLEQLVLDAAAAVKAHANRKALR
jgi:DNA-binding MarR family transcriptional regulator